MPVDNILSCRGIRFLNVDSMIRLCVALKQNGALRIYGDNDRIPINSIRQIVWMITLPFRIHRENLVVTLLFTCISSLLENA